jgi:hypothetical protein
MNGRVCSITNTLVSIMNALNRKACDTRSHEAIVKQYIPISGYLIECLQVACPYAMMYVRNRKHILVTIKIKSWIHSKHLASCCQTDCRP